MTRRKETKWDPRLRGDDDKGEDIPSKNAVMPAKAGIPFPVFLSVISSVRWNYVSEKFARTDFHKAATLVCGASKDSSFFKKEMMSMLDESYLKVLNERPADMFRAFRVFGEDEVHGLMAATYLLEMRRYARVSGDVRAQQNYKRQRKYFVASRTADKKARSAWSDTLRAAFNETRKDILGRFNPAAASNRKARPEFLPLCL